MEVKMEEIPGIILRVSKESDYGIIVGLENTPAFKEFMPRAYSSRLEPTDSKIKHQDWISRIRKRESSGEIFFMIDLVLSEREIKTIGYCNLARVISAKTQLQLNILIQEKYWGNGYGTKASLSLIGFGFARGNLKRIITSAVLRNERSIKMLKKIGFKEESRDGAYMNFVISRKEWKKKNKSEYCRRQRNLAGNFL